MNINAIRLLVTAFVASSVILSGCAASRPQEGADPARRQLGDVMAPEDTTLIASTYDPWEGYNRWMYNFNARFDRYLFAPAAEGYKRFLPKFMRSGVHNFMRNIREVPQAFPVDATGTFSIIPADACCEAVDVGWSQFAAEQSAGFEGIWGKNPPFTAEIVDGTVVSLEQIHIP